MLLKRFILCFALKFIFSCWLVVFKSSYLLLFVFICYFMTV